MFLGMKQTLETLGSKLLQNRDFLQSVSEDETDIKNSWKQVTENRDFLS